MPISARSMMIAGHVSPSAYRRHVADMKGDGTSVPSPGAVDAGELNAAEHQRVGSAIASKPSRGGWVAGGARQPRANAINRKANKKKFPPGKNMTGAGNPSGPVAAPAPHAPVPSRPMYYNNNRG